MENILQKLVAFQTVTGNEQAAHEALEFIASFLTQRGMHVEWFQSGNYESIVASIRAGNKTPKVMLAAHLDVVAASDAAFELIKEDGKLYGRGTLDMKCVIAAYLQLVDDIHDKLEDYDFGIMITTDEEAGGYHGVGQLVAEGYLPTVYVLPDGGDNWQIQLSSKGFVTVKISTTGKTAHGARPWLGQNAIFPLLKTIDEIKQLFPSDAPDANTLNLGKIHGGEIHNQVPDYAEALLDIRLRSETERDWLLLELQKICAKHGASVDILLDGAATAFSLDNPYIAPFAQLIHEVTGVKVTGSHALGSSDARFFAPYDIPCISFYPAGGGHHGPEEYIEEEAFYQLKEILGHYIDQMAKSVPDTSVEQLTQRA